MLGLLLYDCISYTIQAITRAYHSQSHQCKLHSKYELVVCYMCYWKTFVSWYWDKYISKNDKTKFYSANWQFTEYYPNTNHSINSCLNLHSFLKSHPNARATRTCHFWTCWSYGCTWKVSREDQSAILRAKVIPKATIITALIISYI